MTTKKTLIIILCAVFFASCSGRAKLPEGAIAEIGEADPSVAGLTAANTEKMRWEFYDAQKKEVGYAPVPGGTNKFKSFESFNPSGFIVEITGSDGSKRSVPPYLMGEIAYSPDRRYLCFNMRLGTSPNTTAAILDIKSNAVIFSFLLEDKKQVAGAAGYGIAMERVYRRLRMSDGGRYFSSSEFSAGKNSVCLYNFDDKKKIREFESAEFGIFDGEDFYYTDMSASPAVLMKSSHPYNSSEKIGDIEGRIIDASAGKGKVLVTTSDSIYIVTEGKLSKTVDFKEISKKFEIFEVVTADAGFKDDGSANLFLTVKRYLEGKYTWSIYGGIF